MLKVVIVESTWDANMLKCQVSLSTIADPELSNFGKLQVGVDGGWLKDDTGWDPASGHHCVY